MSKLAQHRGRVAAGGIPAGAVGGVAHAPGGIPAGAVAAAGQDTPLARWRSAGARGEYVELPGIGRAFVRLVGHAESAQVESAVIAEMARLGIPFTPMWTNSINLERWARQLAIAVRDPDDHAKQFGTTEEWMGVDDDLLIAAGNIYQDIRQRLDPVSDLLSDDDAKELVEAFKKKDGMSFMAAGVQRLSLWLLSTDALQLSSPTPKSSPGESDLESLDLPENPQ